MAKKEDQLTPLKDILADLFRGSELPFHPEDGQIWQVWDDVVGRVVSGNARPAWIKDRRLRVHVTDPIWLQELELVGESIRDKLNRRLGRDAVLKIDFRLKPG